MKAEGQTEFQERFRWGAFTFDLEPATGFIRSICVGEEEALRGIYVAVRDEVWGTVASDIRCQRVESRSDRGRLLFEATCQRGAIDFVWWGALDVENNMLRYTFAGESRSEFRTNRIGFCVLHPPHLAGHPCVIEQVGGSEREGRFPASISPHQPFKDIRAIGHALADGAQVEARLTGDVFEMEDQRNWTDASFKTYCRPLALPSPFLMKPGDRIQQEIEVRVVGRSDARAREGRSRSGEESARLEPVPAAASLPIPQVGLGGNPLGLPLGSREIVALRDLSLNHLRVDVDLREAQWAPLCLAQMELAKELDVGVELAIHCSSSERQALAGAAKWLAEQSSLSDRIVRTLVYDSSAGVTSADAVAEFRSALPENLAKLSVGGGTNANFAELNRGYTCAKSYPVVAYTINPQVHAFDDRSLMETLEMQKVTAGCAHELLPAAEIVVSPVTFRPRFNVHTGARQLAGSDDDPYAVDSRQSAQFGAAWTLGSLKYLFESPARSLTYYVTHGPRGTLAVRPEQEPAGAGLYPLYHVIKAALSFGAERVVPTRSSQPLKAVGLLLEREGERRLMVANLGKETVTVDCASLGPAVADKREVVELEPYAWTFFDFSHP